MPAPRRRTRRPQPTARQPKRPVRGSDRLQKPAAVTPLDAALFEQLVQECNLQLRTRVRRMRRSQQGFVLFALIDDFAAQLGKSQHLGENRAARIRELIQRVKRYTSAEAKAQSPKDRGGES